MEILNVPRGYGKSIRLILESLETGYPIIVGTKSMKKYLRDTAKKITNKDITVYTTDEFSDENFQRGNDVPSHVLIDELPLVLSVLLNTNVEMATMTSGSLENYEIEKRRRELK